MANKPVYESQRAVCKRTHAFRNSWLAGVRLARAVVPPEHVTERAGAVARAFVARHCQTLSQRAQARFCLTFGEVAMDAYAAAREDSLAMQRTYRPVRSKSVAVACAVSAAGLRREQAASAAESFLRIAAGVQLRSRRDVARAVLARNKGR